MPQPLRRSLLAFLLALCGSAASAPAAAQSGWPFGSSDDPLEGPVASFVRSGGYAAAYAAPTFVGASWRAGVAFEGAVHRGRFAAGLGGTLHSGDGGLYDAEADEPYDLARLLRYARYDTPALYARVGPPTTVTLGQGLLVRDFRTTAAWDERTIGAEVRVRSPAVEVAAFTGDVRGGGVVGAHVEAAPAAAAASPALRSFRLGLGAVHDLGGGDLAPTGVEASARLEVLRRIGLGLSPWVSYAEYLDFGRGVGVGADLGSAEVLGTARARLRLGLFFSDAGFSPGYVGPFYQVSNSRDRIVTAESFFEGDGPLAFAGVPLGDVEGGVDVLTEFDVAVSRAVSLFYHFRRHYGDQRLSDFSFRLALRPGFAEGFGVAVAVERQGLGSFFSLLDDLQNQNTLVLDIDYPLAGAAHLSIRSRYGYTRLEGAADGSGRFLVQRRFEPFVGLRYRF
ncbi:MAG: hypothetical protein R3181_04670 [Rubricoccaceae bacterium]|nr:hypothetical protein [Rubricoccaceae bacterium]